MLSSWLHNIDANVADIQEIEQNDVDSVVQKIYILEQEHSEKLPIINTTQEKLNSAVGSNVSENNSIVAQYNDIKCKYEVS